MGHACVSATEAHDRTSRRRLHTRVTLGAFSRRLAFRVGKAKTVTATARKLAILVYHTLKDGLVYRDPGAEAYDTQHRTHVLRRLRQRAENLGFVLVNRETGEVVEGAVSVYGSEDSRLPRALRRLQSRSLTREPW